MDITKSRVIVVAAALLAPGAILAQGDEGDLEATIRLMDEAEAQRPEAVTREIALPPGLVNRPQDAEPGANGRGRGSEASEGRGERGREIAADARENAAADARENASEMAEAARENAENRSRADEFRPDPPGPPDDPGPPDNPGPPDG